MDPLILSSQIILEAIFSACKEIQTNYFPVLTTIYVVHGERNDQKIENNKKNK